MCAVEGSADIERIRLDSNRHRLLNQPVDGVGIAGNDGLLIGIKVGAGKVAFHFFEQGPDFRLP